MTTHVIGEISVGAAIPGAVASLNLAAPDLDAQISALGAFSPGEINFAAEAQLATAILNGIKTSISMGIKPPSIQLQLQIVLGIIDGIKSKLNAIAAFKGLLSASLFAYGFEGPANQFGTQMGAQLSTGGFSGASPTEQCRALVFGATSNVSYTAMAGVFVGF